MKLENYEIVNSFVIPAYWFEEGDKEEHYWLDMQNLYYHKFDKIHSMSDEDFEKDVENRKYWMISTYKPKGSKVTEKNADELVKWLVSDSWHTDKKHPEYDGVDYEFYEWDFENHTIK